MARRMTRDPNEDILYSILSGGMTGFSGAMEKSNTMENALTQKLMEKTLENKIAQASMPEWAKTGTAPEGMAIKHTVKTPYGSIQLIPTTQKSDPLVNKERELRIAGMEQKQEDIKQKGQKETDLIRQTAQDNLNTIRTIKEGKRYFGPYANLPTLAAPETLLGLNKKEYASRKKWENNINKLLSQKVVDLMNLMKQASRTGATGFGQLNKSELQLLQSASTALTKDLNDDDAMYYLNEMEKLYNKILSGDSNNTNVGVPTTGQSIKEKYGL